MTPRGGRQDRGAHAAQHPRQLVGGRRTGAGPASRSRCRPLITDSRSSVYLSSTRSASNSASSRGCGRPAGAARLLDREVLDVALLLEHARELLVHARRGDHDVVVVGVDGVADAGQEVCYGIGHRSIACRVGSPGGLRHAGDHALVRDLAQADPAQAELAVVGARSSAPPAAIVVAGLVLAAALLADYL